MSNGDRLKKRLLAVDCLVSLNLITWWAELVPSKSNKAAGVTRFLPVMALKEDFGFCHVRRSEVTAAIQSFATITKFEKGPNVNMVALQFVLEDRLFGPSFEWHCNTVFSSNRRKTELHPRPASWWLNPWKGSRRLWMVSTHNNMSMLFLKTHTLTRELLKLCIFQCHPWVLWSLVLRWLPDNKGTVLFFPTEQ